MTDGRAHWQDVYVTKGEADVSWYEQRPALSLELVRRAAPAPSSAIVDIGAGASRLVDALLEAGYQHLTVLDLSPAALDVARLRLGESGTAVTWVSADVTQWQPDRLYDVWHDRAAFHFLAEPAQQATYRAVLDKALRPGGTAVIATFAPDGPERCSGLPVARHDAESIGVILGSGYSLIDTQRHDHTTPWGAVQKFQYSVFRREG